MSALSHNSSPAEWWECSHPGVCLIDLIAIALTVPAFWYVDGLTAKLFVSIVVGQFFFSALYHRRYINGSWLQKFDHTMIMLLTVGTVFPYIHLQLNVVDFWVWVTVLVMIVGAGIVWLYRIKHKSLIVPLMQASFGLVSIWVMWGISDSIGQGLAQLFWLGVSLYALQMAVFYLFRLKYPNIIREVQHGFLLLPPTQIHVWLAVYLF